MSEWISVKERLPDDDAEVLVWDGYRVTHRGFARRGIPCDRVPPNSFVDSQDIPNFGEEAYAVQGVTHWMPLPPPPTEADK